MLRKELSKESNVALGRDVRINAVDHQAERFLGCETEGDQPTVDAELTTVAGEASMVHTGVWFVAGLGRGRMRQEKGSNLAQGVVEPDDELLVTALNAGL